MRNLQYVIVKGVREGLLLILDDTVPFGDVLAQLSEHISAHSTFFNGAGATINGGRRILEAPDFEALYNLLTRSGMRVTTFVSFSTQSRMVAETFGVSSRPPSFAAGDSGRIHTPHPSRSGPSGWASDPLSMAEAGSGLFLRCSLRAGQVVRYGGDVCVLGNVDAGAEIVADGDVVVWGILNGTVHAGADSDDEAVVCALRLSPVQLRIAGAMSRFPARPAQEQGSSSPPELARIEAGRIVVEAWRAPDEDGAE
ncbi:MAG: septum site-determining protein MinC [Chloroflexia bacterium]